MRTIREWLQELEEPHRSKAIKNTLNLNENPDEVFKCVEDSLVESLYSAFIWSGSVEGLEYWVDLKNSL